MQTGLVQDEAAGRPGAPWRPWAIGLPGGLALVVSLLFALADGFAGLMGGWDTPLPGLRWIKVAVIGHCVLAAASILLLGAGLKYPSWRRAAVITTWIIIPVGFGWLLLIGRLVSGS